MATEEQDSFLAMIEAKIAALQALAKSYRTALSVGALGQLVEMDQSVPSPAISGAPTRTELRQQICLSVCFGTRASLTRSSCFWRLSGASRQRRRSPQGSWLVVWSARRSGLIRRWVPVCTDSRLPVSSLRLQDGWDLAESYPEHLRSRIVNSTRTSKPKSKKTVKRRRAMTAKSARKRSEVVSTSGS